MLQRSNQIANIDIELLEKVSIKFGLKPISNNDSEIHWNRYSIVDKDSILKNFLINNNIEASNYNWPVPLHFLFKNNKQFILNDNYSNSEYCSKNILNIPLWKNLGFNENKL